MSLPTLSVVIPSYNSARWLPTTLEALSRAVANATAVVEVIIVNDGSTDNTLEVLGNLEMEALPFRIVSTENRGRFLARLSGLTEAQSKNILFLDSRVLIDPHAIEYVTSNIGWDQKCWNAHSVTRSDNLLGLFWEVPVYVAWGQYLRAPQRRVLSGTNFDKSPKGTTAFFTPKDSFILAAEENWPAIDDKLSNDDTKIIRWLCERVEVVIDPKFIVIYRPRTTIKSFTRHSFDRGSVFVDGFWEYSRRWRALISLAVLAPLLAAATFILGATLGMPILLLVVPLTVFAVWVAPPLIALANSCSPRSISSYLIYFPIFASTYWAGLSRGLLLRLKNGKNSS